MGRLINKKFKDKVNGVITIDEILYSDFIDSKMSKYKKIIEKLNDLVIYKKLDKIFSSKVSNIMLLEALDLISKLKYKDKSRIKNYFKNIKKINIDYMNINLKYKQSYQNRHFLNSGQYKDGGSIMKIKAKRLRKLVNLFSGTGRMINKNHEYVNFGIYIGLYYNKETSKFEKTQYAKIHYSKNGYHVVPCSYKVGIM